MNKITYSAPGKVHLLGEHVVVYGKPALLAAVDLRVRVSVIPAKAGMTERIQKTVEAIIKKHLKIRSLPSYQLSISSPLPIGSGLGSSAAISASFIAALLAFLKVKWDLNLINDLTYQAEKVWHGNPSGADNSTVVFGGLIWYRKETDNLQLIHQLPFSTSAKRRQASLIPKKISKNFILINTGKPKESTKDMVEIVSAKWKVQSGKFKKIFDNQEQLTKELLNALSSNNQDEMIRIIRASERNLESIGVVSKSVASIIRIIEQAGGAAKICGGGGKVGPTGVLLCYHTKPSILKKIAKSYNLSYFKTALGVEGLRKEYE